MAFGSVSAVLLNMIVPLHSRQVTPLQLLEPLTLLMLKLVARINSVVVVNPLKSYPVTVIPEVAISLLPVLFKVIGSLAAVWLLLPNSKVAQVKEVGPMAKAIVSKTMNCMLL